MKRSKGMDSLYGRTDDATRVSGRTVSQTERECIVTKKDYSEEGSGLTERKSNGSIDRLIDILYNLTRNYMFTNG